MRKRTPPRTFTFSRKFEGGPVRRPRHQRHHGHVRPVGGRRADSVCGVEARRSWIPIGFQDYQGTEIARIYSDQFGGYNVLLPSTYRINFPAPSGVSHGMVTIVLNSPGPVESPPGSGTLDLGSVLQSRVLGLLADLQPATGDHDDLTRPSSPSPRSSPTRGNRVRIPGRDAGPLPGGRAGRRSVRRPGGADHPTDLAAGRLGRRGAARLRVRRQYGPCHRRRGSPADPRLDGHRRYRKGPAGSIHRAAGCNALSTTASPPGWGSPFTSAGR